MATVQGFQHEQTRWRAALLIVTVTLGFPNAVGRGIGVNGCLQVAFSIPLARRQGDFANTLHTQERGSDFSKPLAVTAFL